MGRTACSEPQYLYKGALYLLCTNLGGGSLAELASRERIIAIGNHSILGNQEWANQVTANPTLKFYQRIKLLSYLCVCVCVCVCVCARARARVSA